MDLFTKILQSMPAKRRLTTAKPSSSQIIIFCYYPWQLSTRLPKRSIAKVYVRSSVPLAPQDNTLPPGTCSFCLQTTEYTKLVSKVQLRTQYLIAATMKMKACQERFFFRSQFTPFWTSSLTTSAASLLWANSDRDSAELKRGKYVTSKDRPRGWVLSDKSFELRRFLRALLFVLSTSFPLLLFLNYFGIQTSCVNDSSSESLMVYILYQYSLEEFHPEV